MKIVYLLLPFVLLGCSKNEPAAESRSSKSSTAKEVSSRPKISFVEGAEGKEMREIKKQALTLLTNGDFEGLEALAAKYRASKEGYADGFWKLTVVYNGLEPSGNDSDEVWQTRLKRIQDWSKARSETAMPKIALARIMTGYAWKARGGDWGEKVKDKDWEIFFARLQKALVHLQETKRLKEQCPLYWSSIQRIALGLQFEKKQYNAIFAQAIQQYPDYSSYYTMRANYLLPRWYGEEGEWEKDLAKSADRIGGESGDVLYARVVWDMNRQFSSEVSTIFKENKSSWERVDKGFGIILKQFPHSLSAKTERAGLAAMNGEREKARVYFLDTNGDVDLGDWQGKEDFEKFLNWAFGP